MNKTANVSTKMIHPGPLPTRGNDSTSQSYKYTISPSPVASRKEARKSLLDAVSGLKFPGRRRKALRAATTPVNPFHSTPLLIPDVIEIKANSPPRDDECEERERLREAAARAIGLVEEEEVEARIDSDDDERRTDEQRPSTAPACDESESCNRFSLYEVQHRRQSPPQSYYFRAASPSSRPAYLAGHNRTASTLAASPLMPIPSFPSTLSQLTPFIQKSATLPKYYPPTSLRIFALTKLWKSRYFALTSPPTSSFTRSQQQPQPSYLHLFRTSGPEEVEVERLQINEDSVVFVAEEGLVGGRKGVIKVGGADSAHSEQADLQDGPTLTTMWFLQITDTAEAQNWIEIIKSKILLQRSMRAGLGITQGSIGGAIEPRGDMDVMLSMRAQGMFSIPPSSDTASLSSRRSSKAPTMAGSRPATSVSTTPIPTHSNPSASLSTFKGLFGGNRPRSPSAASSLNTTSALSSASDSDSHGTAEGSFAGAGTNLLQLGMLQRSDSSNGMCSNSLTTLNHQPQPRRPLSVISAAHLMERKILQHPFLLVTDDEPPPSPTFQITPPAPRTSLDRANRGLSLQPPPRKRWTSADLSTDHEAPQYGMYNVALGNATTGSLSAVGSGPTPLDLDASSQTTSPIERTRTHSHSTMGSNSGSVEAYHAVGTSARRWSRRGMSLPRRPTPPSGPPPAAPASNATLSVQPIQPHPYSSESVDRRRTSSQMSNTSFSSHHSLISGLPNFNKRSSMNSTFSAATTTSQSSSTANSSTNSPRPMSSHRTSVPPPQRGPPPTTALPAAPTSPGQDVPTPLVTPKPSFRDSVAQRALRLSLVAQKPPPSSSLPPRPDEPDHNRVRRRVSGSSRSLVERGRRSGESLGTIPASPIPPPLTPPNIPLPATPTSLNMGASIKQRLRILSAPSTTSVPREEGVFIDMTPHSPLEEHITPPWIQNDPSFIEDLPPITPTKPRALPVPPVRKPSQPEFQSLSPPPRRRSVQHHGKVETERTRLSRSGSVVSLGIVNA